MAINEPLMAQNGKPYSTVKYKCASKIRLYHLLAVGLVFYMVKTVSLALYPSLCTGK